MLDKYHGRRVREVRVRCWNKDSGCGWVGEVNGLKRHTLSCEKRPWECEYCGLKCTYDEGEGRHWPECSKFPEPCPNGCEVGRVERCGVEQHRSVCPLEPVACEMKEFGCSVVVPRRELATHMRESELQHLTAMTALNLRLTRQLQQDTAERERKFEQLRQDLTERDQKFEQLARQLQLDSAERGKMLEQLQKDSAERDRKIVQLQQDSADRDRKVVQLEPLQKDSLRGTER
ncbi:TNF receptor-associated factor 5 [Geodia barretti]|uniref:TNF receptor-associated factor 5 n=1 Tax=Geodia barretti TaxID=519541 RepID=A0AA35XBU3_GEOBA|nr:TNF receptor-associated factor 5 [Geodia barretti]